MFGMIVFRYFMRKKQYLSQLYLLFFTCLSLLYIDLNDQSTTWKFYILVTAVFYMLLFVTSNGFLLSEENLPETQFIFSLPINIKRYIIEIQGIILIISIPFVLVGFFGGIFIKSLLTSSDNYTDMNLVILILICSLICMALSNFFASFYPRLSLDDEKNPKKKNLLSDIKSLTKAIVASIILFGVEFTLKDMGIYILLISIVPSLLFYVVSVYILSRKIAEQDVFFDKLHRSI